MTQEKKIEKILEDALSADLTDYLALLKSLKKRLPFLFGTRLLTAALLKDYLGDISRLDLSLGSMPKKTETGSVIFEDINEGRARLFINIGKNHHVSPGDLIRETVKKSGIDGKLVGKIDIHATYSFIEIPVQYAELVLLSLDKARIKGIPIIAEPAKKRKKEN